MPESHAQWWIGIAVAVLALIVGVSAWLWPRPERSTSTSISEAREKTRQGFLEASPPLRPVKEEDALLRGSARKSYVYILADLEFPLKFSHEIRIYDESDGELDLSFSFQPDVLRGPPLLFELYEIVDLEGDGVAEILGSFSPLSKGPAQRFPVVIWWSDHHGDYRMAPVLPKIRQMGPKESMPIPPDLRHESLRRSGHAFPAHVFGIGKWEGSNVLVAGFITDSRRSSMGTSLTLDIRGWLIFEEDFPLFQPCPERVVFEAVDTAEPAEVVRAWMKRGCVPR